MRQVAIYRSGVRSVLFLGCDREMIMLAGLLVGVMIFSLMQWSAAAIGVVMWLFCLWVLRLAAKHDPILRGVYLRSLQYGKYHPPRASPFAAGRKYL